MISQRLKSKSPLALALLFYTGIAGSALLLVLLQFNNGNVWVAYTVIALTFMLGVLAVTAMSRSAKQVVVYLEKQKDVNASKDQQHTGIQSQLNMQVLTETTPQGAQRFLNEICKQLQAGQAAVYKAANEQLNLMVGYALNTSEQASVATYAFGEGLIGRVAVEGTPLYIDKLPENYITIFSGLGSASPRYLMIVPLKDNEGVKGVLELALFVPLNNATRNDLLKVGELLTGLI